MLYNFSTDNVRYAKAAQLLYALYKSRDTSSPMNGVETWNRVEAYCKGACKKSRTTSEFVTKFKEMGKVGALKPKYMANPEHKAHMLVMPDGTVLESDSIREFNAEILQDDDVRKTIETDYCLIVFLVRERIEREKAIATTSGEEKENEED